MQAKKPLPKRCKRTPTLSKGVGAVFAGRSEGCDVPVARVVSRDSACHETLPIYIVALWFFSMRTLKLCSV